MNQQWQQISAYVNALSRRERIIVLLVVLALEFLIIDFLWLGDQLNRRSALSSQLEEASISVEQASSQLHEFQGYRESARVEAEQQRKALEQQLQKLDNRLADVASGFIPARIMPEVLEKVLAEQNGLALLALSNSSPAVVFGEAEDTGDGPVNESRAAALYRHGVELEVSGSYHAVLTYLEKLEGLPWSLHWEALEYRVDEYPQGVMSLRVYTYSTDKEWIGV